MIIEYRSSGYDFARLEITYTDEELRKYIQDPKTGKMMGSTSDKGVGGVDKSAEKGLTNEKNRHILKEKVANGKISLVLNPEMQNPHIYGTSAYNVANHKSYFVVSESELQNIVNNKYGTGDVIISRSGQIKEILNTAADIGVCVSLNGEIIGKTNRVTIHYSKGRTHIVPTKRS